MIPIGRIRKEYRARESIGHIMLYRYFESNSSLVELCAEQREQRTDAAAALFQPLIIPIKWC